MFLLDTDHLGILQRQHSPDCVTILRRMAEFQARDFFVSIVSFHEQVRGWNAYLNQARRPDDVVRAFSMFEGILRDFSSMQVLPFDDAASEVFESFRQQRIRVGTMDLRIASVAIAKGLVILSRNLSDFSRVPGLTVEDWTIETVLEP